MCYIKLTPPKIKLLQKQNTYRWAYTEQRLNNSIDLTHKYKAVQNVVVSLLKEGEVNKKGCWMKGRNIKETIFAYKQKIQQKSVREGGGKESFMKFHSSNEDQKT